MLCFSHSSPQTTWLLRGEAMRISGKLFSVDTRGEFCYPFLLKMHSLFKSMKMKNIRNMLFNKISLALFVSGVSGVYPFCYYINKKHCHPIALSEGGAKAL